MLQAPDDLTLFKKGCLEWARENFVTSFGKREYNILDYQGKNFKEMFSSFTRLDVTDDIVREKYIITKKIHEQT